jgi:hypothetical protein
LQRFHKEIIFRNVLPSAQNKPFLLKLATQANHHMRLCHPFEPVEACKKAKQRMAASMGTNFGFLSALEQISAQEGCLWHIPSAMGLAQLRLQLHCANAI